jgi:hypothetical protein|tara:strand:+ start:663 stop:1010 length:348 start_codon:yes stop_codon:yes gene_type:complete
MAQNFASSTSQLGTGTTALYTNTTSSPVSADAIIGIRAANILATAITISVWISPLGSGTVYIAKDLSIPPNSSVELVQGGAKFVLNDTDVLNANSSDAASVDVVTSVVKAISTAS